MGWFTIALVLGFLAYSAWMALAPVVTVQKIVAAGIVAIIAIALGFLLFAPAGAFSDLGFWIGSGGAARLMIGSVLGMGLSYARTQQLRPASLWLSIAGAALVAALVAPYIDTWLAHITGLKASFIEVQLANVSPDRKSVEADNREFYCEEDCLRSLRSYDKSIERDIAYIDNFALKDLEYRLAQNTEPREGLENEKKKLVGQKELLLNLNGVFEKVISPSADCLLRATENGLDVESARELLRPLSNLVMQMVVLEEKGERDRVQKIHDRIWDLVGVPEGISDYLDQQAKAKCAAIQQAKKTITEPSYSDLKGLPHSDVARALLLWFVLNDKFAMKALREGAGKDFKDLNTPLLLGRLMYTQNESADRFFDILDGMRSMALKQEQLIKKVFDRCASLCDAGIQRWEQVLLDRARAAELLATNLIVYSIAQDVAKGRDSALSLLPIAEDYGERLKAAAKDPAYEAVRDDSFLDTAAFVTIVAEAHRARSSDLNKAKVRESMSILEGLVAREGERVSSLSVRQKASFSRLSSFQSHLAAARTLLE